MARTAKRWVKLAARNTLSSTCAQRYARGAMLLMQLHQMHNRGEDARGRRWIGVGIGWGRCGRMQHEQSSGMNNKVGCCWINLRWIIRRRCHAIWLDSDDNQLVTVTDGRGGRSNNKPNNCRRSKSNERREMIEYIIYAPTILVLELIIIVFKRHQSLIAKSTNSQ